MRLQARKRNARQIERIDPEILEQRVARWRFRCEAFVESGVMSNHRRVTDKLGQASTCLVRKGRIHYVFVVDIGQTSDFVRDMLPGVDKRHEPFRHNTAFEAGGRYLRELVVVLRKTRRLGIEDNDIAIEVAKIGGFRIVFQSCIALDDVIWSTLGYEVVYTHVLHTLIFQSIVDGKPTTKGTP